MFFLPAICSTDTHPYPVLSHPALSQYIEGRDTERTVDRQPHLISHLLTPNTKTHRGEKHFLFKSSLVAGGGGIRMIKEKEDNEVVTANED